MNRTSTLVRIFSLFAGTLSATAAFAGSVSISYTELPLGATTDLTAVGVHDWVKWGTDGQSGPAWSVVRKDGVTPIINSTLFTLGTPPQGIDVITHAVPNENVLNFDWSDGDSPPSGSSDTVVTETLDPPQGQYPLDLGVFFSAQAAAETRVLDVWVQGFNANTLLFALMDGGQSDSLVISPTKVVNGNNYSSGVLRVVYSGAGESVSITVVTLGPEQPGAVAFPNAGVFAAAIVPEPASIVLLGIGAVAMGLVALRRRRP